MEDRKVTLKEVLEFREEKAQVQKRMHLEHPNGTVVSLGMNIPGPVKTGSSILHAFSEGKSALKKAILGKNGTIADERTLEEKAGYAAVYLVKGLERRRLKEISVSLEETHPLGRIFDVDILNANLEPVSRTELGAARRKCLICNRDAKVCGRSRAHTVQELQRKTAEMIGKWEEKQRSAIARSIGAKAWMALLEEVYTTPKPGLVDLYSCGAHSDMDVAAFERSAKALYPYFVQMAALGYELCVSPEELFRRIRVIGMGAERAMYRATGGVNTHKGLLFTLGIFCAAAGRCFREEGTVTEKMLFDMEHQMAARILAEEIRDLERKEPESHGEKNLKMYGSAGVRGEAVNGYPAIRTIALPALRQGIAQGKEWNLVKLQTLFRLMSEVEDSNILSRHDPQTLCLIHAETKLFLEDGGAYAKDAIKKLRDMDQDYSSRRISAGGCADLLAAAVFILSLQTENTDMCGKIKCEEWLG